MGEQMQPKELAEWREKLRFGKEDWERRGYIGTSSAASSSLQTLIEFYRGNMWGGLDWAGLSKSDLMTVNKIFPIANSIDGDVAARRPELKLRGKSEHSAPLARPVQTLINNDLEEIGWKRQTNRAMRDHLFAPVGILRHGFTPQVEFEATVGKSKRPRRLQRFRSQPDRPWVQRYPIWNTLMDPSSVFFHPDEGMRWVAFREIALLDDIKANENMITREDLKDFAGNIDPQWAPHPRDRENENDPEQDQYVECFTVYDAIERTWFQITLDGLDKPLREKDDWPIPWETLPISIFSVNEQMDTPHPVSILENAIPVQNELKKVRTIIHTVALATRRIIVAGKGISKEEVDKIEDAPLVSLIRASGNPSEALAQFTAAAFPSDLLAYENILDEDLREIAGQSKMGRGQRINVESAEEASHVQRGQDVNISRISDAFEDFNLQAAKLYMQGRRKTMELTGAETVAVVGEGAAQKITEWTSVTPAHLAEDFAIEIEVGSTRRFDRDREAQLAAFDLKQAVEMPDFFKAAFFARKYVEFRGYDPEQAMTPNALLNSFAREGEMLLQRIQNTEQGGTEAPTGGVDANAINLIAGQGGNGVAQ